MSEPDGPAPAPDEGPEAQAERAALAWLELVDAGAYAESWREAAGTFRTFVEAAAWDRQLTAVRSALGACRERRRTAARYATELPGAPDGEYVVLEFASSFENKASAVETVTPMREEDGQWRVSGYFIR
ncbi:MAG: DUF4019 domain-containing protein [Gemmatimonadota bacterium]